VIKAGKRRSRANRGRRRNEPTGDELSLVQTIARELAGQRIRGSLTKLSHYSQIGLDSLRQLKRQPDAAGARTISPTRLRILALLVAAHRMGVFDDLLADVEELERDWRRKHPEAIRLAGD
jgi:hypothetical protein